uniref:Amino acid permease/ SLC12A domain-containing protein n=1 Tax=Stegastes partitus TaxID=144197 RepID=A0A3B4YZS2_9TELE
MEGDKQKLSLRREVGLIEAVSFIAGTMIGSGIFTSPKHILFHVAMLGGLCFAELGMTIPESGGEYVYMLHSCGEVFAFMFIFSFIKIIRPASATAIALSFADYAVALFYDGCPLPQLAVKSVATGAILLAAIANLFLGLILSYRLG